MPASNENRKAWEKILPWLAPILMTIILAFFALWNSNMKGVAVSEAINQMETRGTSLYYPLPKGTALEKEIAALNARLDRLENKQDEALKILIQMAKER